MAITSPNFSVTQALASPSDFSIEDTSTGSDNAVVQRQITVFDANGVEVDLGTYSWPYATTSITISDVLTRDNSWLFTVDWLNVSDQILYTKTKVVTFTTYDEIFLLARIRDLASNPQLANSKNYFSNVAKLRTLIDNANQATTYGNDQTAAQICLDLAQELVDNLQYFY